MNRAKKCKGNEQRVHHDTVLTEGGRLEALPYVVAASPPK